MRYNINIESLRFQSTYLVYLALLHAGLLTDSRAHSNKMAQESRGEETAEARSTSKTDPAPPHKMTVDLSHTASHLTLDNSNLR